MVAGIRPFAIARELDRLDQHFRDGLCAQEVETEVGHARLVRHPPHEPGADRERELAPPRAARLTADQALRLWALLAAGDVDEVRRLSSSIGIPS